MIVGRDAFGSTSRPMGMAAISFAMWIANLYYQTTYGGVDMTFGFDWVRCKDKENSTWVGGFDWEC